MLWYKRLKLLAPEGVVDPLYRLSAPGGLFRAGRFPRASAEAAPFFIVGSGRSGNTLLRSMLCAHPGIGIPPEFGGFRSAFRAFSVYGHLTWSDVVDRVLDEVEAAKSFDYWNLDLRPVRDGLVALPESKQSFGAIIEQVYRAFVAENFDGERLWGDKTPLNAFNLSRIDKTFPNARYIHMLRDGRDVVASFLKANLNSASSLESAAWHWRDATRRVRRFLAARSRPDLDVEVRYEDLVVNPRDTLESVCRVLGVPFSEAMLEHDRVFSKLGDTHLAHHENVSRKVSTGSIGKWRDAFDDTQRRRIDAIIGKDLAALGYGAH